MTQLKAALATASPAWEQAERTQFVAQAGGNTSLGANLIDREATTLQIWCAKRYTEGTVWRELGHKERLEMVLERALPAVLRHQNRLPASRTACKKVLDSHHLVRNKHL